MRRDMGLDDQGIVIGNDLQQHFTGPDDAANRKDFQVLHSARDGSRDVKSLKYALRDAYFFARVADLLPDLDNRASNLFISSVLHLLNLEFRFSNFVFRFCFIGHGAANYALLDDFFHAGA